MICRIAVSSESRYDPRFSCEPPLIIIVLEALSKKCRKGLSYEQRYCMQTIWFLQQRNYYWNILRLGGKVWRQGEKGALRSNFEQTDKRRGE